MSIVDASRLAPRPAAASSARRRRPSEDRPCATALGVRFEFVHRPALVSRLSAHRNAALALIVAPPGYGKTCLLADWARYDDRAFLPLTVDRAARAEDVIQSLRAELRPMRPDSDACVVVIDDAELLDPALLREVAQIVWKRLPPESTLALAARTEPDLPVGRLRAHHALIEIRMHDLAMGPEEATLLLSRAGLELDPQSRDALLERTEGWPAALYLAALSARNHAPLTDGEAEFRGNDHLMAEYLHDEVLGQLPARLMTFLRRASVLDELNGDVCDAVLRRSGSGVMLSKLSQVTSLIEPRDRAHEIYGWHPLFRDAVAAELHRGEPQTEVRLHARAQQWYRGHGDLDRAIEHGVASQDAQSVGELLWPNVVGYLSRGQAGQIERWLGGFSPEIIARNPTLAAAAAHTALVSGDGEAAHRWARDAASGTPGSPPADSLAAALAIVDVLAAPTGIVSGAGTLDGLCASEPENSAWRPMCLWLSGVAQHLCAQDHAAAEALLDMASEAAGHTYPLVSILATSQRAMIAMEARDWELATELTDGAAALIADTGFDQPIAALAYASAAAARARVGRSDEAKHDLRAGRAAASALGESLAWYAAETRILLAHASLYLADVGAARGLLAQASRLARRTATAMAFEPWFDDAWAYLDTIAETSLTGPSALTIAELRVLRFLPSCRPFREIAEQLGVSANTVKTQAHAVYRKLGAGSRSEAVSRARAAGLLGQ